MYAADVLAFTSRSIVRLLIVAIGALLFAPEPAAHANTVAAGAYHTVVVVPDGTVYTLGGNSNGQLGDNSLGRKVPGQVSGLTSVTHVAAGSSHTLVLRSDGTVWAFGANSYGQLGDGTWTQRTSPVAVLGLSNVVAIAAAGSHSVALTSDGSVWAWGANGQGQLGNGTTTHVNQPIFVSSISNAAAIAAGATHTLVVTTGGAVWGFGANSEGQLGDASTTGRTSPVQMTGISTATAVAAGSAHSLILLSDGTVKSVGYNGYGQLGDNTYTRRTTPVSVSGLTNVAAIAAGLQQSYARKTDGSVWAWGYNWYGSLGDGTTTTRLLPVQSGVSSIAAFAAGDSHVIAVTANGVVWTWGYNVMGQLGDGTIEQRNTPIAISEANYAWKVGTPVLSVASGTYYSDLTVTVTCATSGVEIHYSLTGADPTEADPIVASGGAVAIDQTRTLKVRAWKAGMPTSEIASATYTMVVAAPSISPWGGSYTAPRSVTLSTTTPATTIRYTTDGSTPTGGSPIYSGSLTISTTSTLKAVGFRSGWTTSSVSTASFTMNFGTLSPPELTPVQTTHTTEVVVTMTAMAGATIRYTTDGSTPSASSTAYVAPITVTTSQTITARAFHPDYTTSASASRAYTIVVATPTLTPVSGTYNAGQTITIATATPGATITYTLTGAEPTASDAVVPSGGTLVAGNYTIKVKAWKTQCTPSGTATATYAVTGTLASARVSGGSAHSLALRSDGLIWAWGENGSGQLGIGNTTRQLLPTLIGGLTGTTMLAAGFYHSLSVGADGRVFGWGYNGDGVFGDGTTTSKNAPTAAGTGYAQVATSRYQSIGLKTDGTVWGWGSNAEGALGDGTTTLRTSPVSASGLSGVQAIAAGERFSLAVKTDGTLWSWGTNWGGQLGIGSTTSRSTPGQVSGLSGVTTVAAGMWHSMALLSDGTVRSWGYNGNGRLGDGTNTQRTSPVTVTGLSNIVAIAAGGHHSLALSATGAVWSWGSNSDGRLGDGTTTERFTPVAAIGLPSIVAIAAGSDHSMAIGADGSVWTWGANAAGQLGDGTQTSRSSPVQIADAGMTWKIAAPVFSVGAGTHNVAQTVTVTIADAGAVIHYTTSGTSPTESDPVVASGGTVAVNQTLTLKARGWKPGAVASEVTTAIYELKAVTPAITPTNGGYASAQSVGMSTTTTGATLRYTLDGSDPTAAAAAYSSPITVGFTGTVRVRAFKSGWTTSDAAAASYWITEGVVATPTISPSAGTHPRFTLVALASGTPQSTIRYTVDGSDPVETSPAYRGPLLLSSSTTMKAKAFKTGYVASGTATATLIVDASNSSRLRLRPSQGLFDTRQTVTVGIPTGFVARYTVNGNEPALTDPEVPAGGIVLDQSRIVRVRAWGSGVPSGADEHGVFGLTGSVAAGLYHTLVLTADGVLWAWGHNSNGQLGDGTIQTRDTPVQVMTEVASIAAGRYHSMVLKRDGSVWAFGSNSHGQFCNNSTATTVSSPTQITQLTNVVAFAGGMTHTLALRNDGTVWACGANDAGQLGDGTTTARLTPVQVIGLRGIRSIAAGTGFSLAVEDDGSEGGIVWAWGTNTLGQLGDGTAIARSMPVRVVGLDRVVQVAAGESFALARLADSTVRAWGANTDGQLGNATTVESRLPIVVTPLSGIRRVMAGERHALAVDRNGRLWGWGSNDGWQLATFSGTEGRTYVTPQTLSTAPLALAAGGGRSHSAVLGVDGSIWATGSSLALVPQSIGRIITGLSTADPSLVLADQDDDGVPTWRELTHGTDPLNGDTDGNGLSDSVDLAATGDGQLVDDDGDGLANVVELALGTDPFVADSDGDGVADNTDAFPLDPSRTAMPPPNPSDTTPPVITLTEPTTARPRPPVD